MHRRTSQEKVKKAIVQMEKELRIDVGRSTLSNFHRHKTKLRLKLFWELLK